MLPELADAVPLSPPFQEVANRMHQRSIWLGPKGTQTPLHRDPYHNLLCQVAWTPHPETALLHWSSVRLLPQTSQTQGQPHIPPVWTLHAACRSFSASQRQPSADAGQSSRKGPLLDSRVLQVWGTKMVRLYSPVHAAKLHPFPNPFLRNTSQVTSVFRWSRRAQMLARGSWHGGRTAGWDCCVIAAVLLEPLCFSSRRHMHLTCMRR